MDCHTVSIMPFHASGSSDIGAFMSPVIYREEISLVNYNSTIFASDAYKMFIRPHILYLWGKSLLVNISTMPILKVTE